MRKTRMVQFSARHISPAGWALFASTAMIVVNLLFIPVFRTGKTENRQQIPFSLGTVKGSRLIDQVIGADSPLRSRPILKADAYSTHFMNPDGTDTAVITAVPHNVKVNGEWVPIDTALEKSADPAYDYQTATAMGIYLSRDGSVSQKDNGFVNGTGAPRLGAFDPQTRTFLALPNLDAPRVSVHDNVLSLSGDNTRVEITMRPEGTREDIVIGSRSVASSVKPDLLLAVRSAVITSGTLTVNGKAPVSTLELTPSDSLGLESGGKTVSFPFPKGWDKAGATAPVRRFLTNDNGTWNITTAVPVTWLNASGRAYPVTIDPDNSFTAVTAQSIFGQNATYSTARSTSAGYNGNPNLYVGQNFAASVYYVWEGFIKFDTTSLGAGTTVTDASMAMSVNSDNSTTDFDIILKPYDWSAADPISAANREASFDGCRGMATNYALWRNTSGIVVGTPYTNTDPLVLSTITTGAPTYYCATSSRQGTTPTGKEYVNIDPPVLTVTYTLPSCSFSNQNATYALPSDCSFAGYTDEDNAGKTVDGLDNGDINLNGHTLWISPDQTITWAPGKQIIIGTGSIAFNTNSVMTQAYLQRRDQDNDHMGATLNAKISSTAALGGYSRFKDLLSVSATDCQDSGTNSNIVMYSNAGCGNDIDQDTIGDDTKMYTCLNNPVCNDHAGTAATYGWDTATSNVVALNPSNTNDIVGLNDCDNTHPEVYQALNCYKDIDGDGWSTNTNMATCMGKADHGTVTCATATSGVTARAQPLIKVGTNVVQFTASNGSDCDDSRATVYKAGTCYIDKDGDGYSTASSVNCIGRADKSSSVTCATALSGNTGGGAVSTVGSGAGYIGGFKTSNTSDCDDSSNPSASPTIGTNPSSYVYTAANCYKDGDGDTYFGASVAHTCIGNDAKTAATCANATYGNNGSGGATSAYTAGQLSSTPGVDCDDTNSAVYQNLSCYVDADHDGIATSTPSSVCTTSVCDTFTGTDFDFDSFEAGPGSADDWQLRNGVDPDITNTTAYHGSYSLHFPSGWGRNFEGGSGEPATAFDTNTYPYMCMAYKIPNTTSTNMLILVNENSAWYSVTMTGGECPASYGKAATWGPMIADNTWHYRCINLDAQLDASLGTGTHTVSGLIMHDGGGMAETGEFWIDDFRITSQPLDAMPEAGSDCAPADATAWQNVTGYTDADGDGYRSGTGAAVCVGRDVSQNATYKKNACAPVDCRDDASYLTSSSIDSGTGADGSFTCAAGYNLNVSSLVGRGYADMVAYRINGAAAGQSYVVATSTPGGIAAGDEVMVVNTVSSTSADYGSAGLYDTARVSSVVGTTIYLDRTLSYTHNSPYYAMVMRIPNYNDVTMNSGCGLYPYGFNGSMYGVFAMRVKGTLLMSGSAFISVNGSGYRGGPQLTYNPNGAYGGPGEARPSTNGGSGTNSPWDSGGGGSFCSDFDSIGGAGGGYATTGQAGTRDNDGYRAWGVQNAGGTGVLNDPAVRYYMMFGGGGGGGMYGGGAGGTGGGAIALWVHSLYGAALTTGGIWAKGTGPAAGGGTNLCSGGGGAGGSIYLVTDTTNLAAAMLRVDGGAGAGGWGNSYSGSGSGGRIFYRYVSGIYAPGPYWAGNVAGSISGEAMSGGCSLP